MGGGDLGDCSVSLGIPIYTLKRQRTMPTRGYHEGNKAYNDLPVAKH